MSKKTYHPPRLLFHVDETQLQLAALREGEKDKRLQNYYVGRDRYVARAIDREDPASVFVGPKGVGKSAILQMVRIEKSSDHLRIIDILPDDLAFHSLTNIEASTPILSDAGRHQHLFKALWDYVLTTEIARREHKTTINVMKFILSIIKPDERRLRRLLHKTFDDDGNVKSMSARMLSLISEIQVGLPDGTSVSATLNADQATSHNLSVLNEITAISKALTRPGAIKSQYFILIDDLDVHWHNSPIQNAFIGSLFQSLRVFSYSPQIKVVVSLRDNIFEAIPIPEKDKVRDSVVQVSWDKQALREMVETRLAAIIPGCGAHIWSDLFSAKAFERILAHTNQMPREVIRLSMLTLIHAKQNDKRTADSSDLEQAIIEFSRERLADLASLHYIDYPGLARIFNFLRGWKPQFGNSELQDLMLDISIAMEAEQDEGCHFSWAGGFADEPLGLAKILLSFGFLNYKSSRTANPEPFDPDIHGLSAKTWFEIHPMYYRALTPRIS